MPRFAPQAEPPVNLSRVSGRIRYETKLPSSDPLHGPFKVRIASKSTHEEEDIIFKVKYSVFCGSRGAISALREDVLPLAFD